MIGFSANSNSITGVSNANINVIKSDNITSSTYNGIPAQDILYLSNLTGNVQQQFNNINTTLDSGGHIATLTIGTVTDLPNGTAPIVTVDPTSTTTNKILNFGLERGMNGTNGIDGINGIKPTFTVGIVTDLASGTTPTATITGTSTNPILNL